MLYYYLDPPFRATSTHLILKIADGTSGKRAFSQNMPKRKADEALETGKSKAAKKGSAKRGAKRAWNTPVFRVTRQCRILAVTGVVNTQVADSGGY